MIPYIIKNVIKEKQILLHELNIFNISNMLDWNQEMELIIIKLNYSKDKLFFRNSYINSKVLSQSGLQKRFRCKNLKIIVYFYIFYKTSK